MTARTLMIQGTASHVGKSVITAGFCRLFARRGYRTAPFKAQNMALNSYVTPDGREIGRSQAFQARAAGIEPTAEMNPVLLKPSSETGSQVIVLGRAVRHMGVREYHDYQSIALEAVAESLAQLRSEFDLVVMEGAGSPAEINLRDRDIANMRAATLADAPVILVGDIERGGLFASLYGTLALLLPAERRRVAGIIINKFRGDASLLASGLEFLEKECGVPVLGVLPFIRDLRVDEEDSLALPQSGRTASGMRLHATAEIAVIRLPHISNFTDFDALDVEGDLAVRYVDRLADWGRPDLVIIPGTKSTVADLAWLRKQGLADAVIRHATNGGRVLGICGGFQMLGTRILDPDGIESLSQSESGFGLLDVETSFRGEKALARVEGTGCGGWMEGVPAAGYEIHHGSTVRGPHARALLRLRRPGGGAFDDGAIDSTGRVCGAYVHGLFDHPEVRAALRRFLGVPPVPSSPGSDAVGPACVFDQLADWLEQNLDMEALLGIVGINHPSGAVADR